jgi:hypothetical protein
MASSSKGMFCAIARSTTVLDSCATTLNENERGQACQEDQFADLESLLGLHQCTCGLDLIRMTVFVHDAMNQHDRKRTFWSRERFWSGRRLMNESSSCTNKRMNKNYTVNDRETQYLSGHKVKLQCQTQFVKSAEMRLCEVILHNRKTGIITVHAPETRGWP